MDVARAIADAYFDRPAQVAPIVGRGSVNRVFTADDGARRVILRLPADDDRHRAAAFYAKERWCLEQAAALGIPGPRVLADGARDGWAFQVLTFVEGVPGKESDLPRAAIWRALGDYARRFHGVARDGFGETLPEMLGGDGREGWLGFVDYNLRSLVGDDPLVGLGVYAADQREAIRAVFERLRVRPVRIGLCHGDLARRNTIVGADRTVHLLDWGCAEAHLVPHYDLLAVRLRYPHDPTAFDSFCDGYGLAPAERPALLAEIDDLALLKSFDLTRWAIDRCPERTGECAEKARRLADARRIGHP